ncbi:MAG: GNAT family N-acetyltransferase [Eubacteriales bacterium]|nr:GNAT family N-acetyltransferase [Eubacteriales bacterium]
MKYNKTITLKDGTACLLRNGTESDAKALLDIFNLTHEETDFLLTYPSENTFDVEKEYLFLKEKTESDNEIEILALINNTVVGSAGIEAVGTQCKLRHRAEAGISIAKKYWGLGIGKALMEACIECAKAAGYIQLELEVVADNERAVSLYRKLGFIEYGRNPKGFKTLTGGFQELVHMRLEL